MHNIPTFPGLLTLPSNRFAFAAGAAVAAHPGSVYNPLWIYGPTGTGKTALLHAMLRQLRDSAPELRIRYIQAEDLLQGLLHATIQGSLAEFQAELSELDVLMVDHMNIMLGKTFTQDAAGYLLAKLAAGGCQVVLASSLGPDRLKNLAQILAHRCAFFLRADISTPNPRERLALTRSMARELEVPLSGSMPPRIAFAGRCPSGIRCLLTQLAARRQLLGSDAGDPSEVLDHLLIKGGAV